MTASIDPLGTEIRAITRPDASLLKYYIITALFAGPAFFLVILPLVFRYYTLRYRFDEEGISMSWGVLFHQEVYLTYRRIQDIHVTRNVIHRWLGLSSVAVQTASGSSGAEMTIEGITNPERLRDFLYTRMRGARGERDQSHDESSNASARPASSGTPEDADDEALRLLREIRDELRQLQRQGEAQ